MYSKPVQFYEFLAHHELVDTIYKSIDSPDLAEPVMTVLEILKKTKHLPQVSKERKTESKSTILRNEGNKAFVDKQYQKALICYNRALLFAPKNSRAMKLAYSNRSALLLKIKALTACLNDIDTCFSMECPQDLKEKLHKRKGEAINGLWREKLAEAARMTTFTDEFFKFDKKNPQIPCASTDVGVIVENNVPKIVATKDIKVGAVLAVEKAFVSINNKRTVAFSCYYCHNMSYNLQPCDGCVFALFCSDECKETCGKEYHDIECQLMEIMENISTGDLPKMALKAVLKMRHMCKSWKEFASASKLIGLDRIKKSSINEIYDSNQPFSVLNIRTERHFLHGAIYNSSFVNAAIVYYLENIPCFLPRAADEKSQMCRIIARLLMFFSIYPVYCKMVQCVSLVEKKETEAYGESNFGLFSFLGKLPNACHSNCITIGINKELGLIAVAPIKRGEQLTIPYLCHWLENRVEKLDRQKSLLMYYGSVCNCVICSEEYKNDKTQLTDLQKKNFRKLNLEEMKENFNAMSVQSIYSKVCKTMAFLNDVPFSNEYREIYTLFRKCLVYIQDIEGQNFIIE